MAGCWAGQSGDLMGRKVPAGPRERAPQDNTAAWTLAQVAALRILHP